MHEIVKMLLKKVADWKGQFTGAFNIRVDGGCFEQQSSRNIHIKGKTDAPGLDIYVAEDTAGETVYIPACVTHGNIDDLVYNDFHVGKNANIVIVAGCGVHTENEEPARHNGIHRFFLEAGARVKYIEKHIGTGNGTGIRSIDPVTEIVLAESAVMEMDTSQIGGVDRSVRDTKATLAAGAKLLIRERLLTEGKQQAQTNFTVQLDGKDAGVDIVSRAVARGHSYQSYVSTIIGNAPCSGHSECDAIIDADASVDATPRLCAHHCDASLIHEAAIGKIAGEQILKLRTLGLSEQEAEAKIIEGFLA